MSFFSKLFGKKKSISKETLLDAEVCPNCWGTQAYDDQYFEYVEDQTKSNINHDHAHQKAFIQQFVETHVSGIKLKQEGASLQCPSCKSKFNANTSS